MAHSWRVAWSVLTEGCVSVCLVRRVLTFSRRRPMSWRAVACCGRLPRINQRFPVPSSTTSAVYTSGLLTSLSVRPRLMCLKQLLTSRRYFVPSVLFAFSALTLLVWRWGAGVVICLERGADLHTAQLMPLPLTVSLLQ